MSKLAFNFTRGCKTPKGGIRPVRIVTPDHEAYKIYELAHKLQTEAGFNNPVVAHKYVDLATKQINGVNNE